MLKKKLHDYIELFWEFFKLGMLTVGGGIAMIPLIQRVAVERKKWLSEEDMIDCIAVCQSLPGVIAINVATYIGFKTGRTAGAVVATLGVILLSFCAIMIVVEVLRGIGDNEYVSGALAGFRAAAAGLIAYAAFGVSANVIKNVFAALIAVASALAVIVLDINAVYVVAACILIGIFYRCLTVRSVKR